MSKSVEFFFDFGSPATYLAWTQLPKIAAEAGAEIVWRPFLLGGVFKATGNRSPVEVPAKGRYTMRDFARFAERYGVPLRFNPHFPINTLQLMRGAASFEGDPREVIAVDLRLDIYRGAGLRAVFTYREDLWAAATIERLAGHFQNLLDAVVRGDRRSELWRLPLLGLGERRRLLDEWAAAPADYNYHQCLHRLIERQARATPDAPAVITPDARLTVTSTGQTAAPGDCLALRDGTIHVIHAGVPTDGCRHCGLPAREHMQRWEPGPGWHKWAAPTQDQIKDRMLARRAQRKGQ